MMGMLDGKVAFITGAARGQGRSHAIRFAREGADIVALDICDQVPTVAYDLATSDDLVETAAAVEALGRRIIARQGDVRDIDRLKEVVAEGESELGGLDIIVANAGIAAMGSEDDPSAVFRDLLDINLVGVYNTVIAAVPSLIEKRSGAIVLTSSTQGLKGTGGNGSGGASGYAASKHGVVGLMRSFTHWLGPMGIRVNTVHPTGVATPMIQNPHVERLFAENPEAFGDSVSNILPVPWVESNDVSDAVLYLVSEMGRYVTGVALPVDAGFTAR
ncbi:mycofactocin-coupled SDR family oxidoreductase [Gordonia sp. NPDC127522]|uniref:mycofactocin-coupled SDR family oxidoreductase n=1 Tax=Gordonia sp. NPDC127522 TaxID=3345390 RepID=UPI00362E8537